MKKEAKSFILCTAAIASVAIVCRKKIATSSKVGKNVSAKFLSGVGAARKRVTLTFEDVDNDECQLTFYSIGRGYCRAHCYVDGEYYSAELPIVGFESINEYRDPEDYMTRPEVYDDPILRKYFVKCYSWCVDEILSYNNAPVEIIY